MSKAADLPSPSPRPLELLAPALDADTAIEAMLHGADAVYIGGPSHGARRAAANSLDDLKRVVDFAHPFGVRVFVTVNTLVYDSEVRHVERLMRDLWRIGIDAAIVQDMALLRMDIPPIELHASTQCDIRTPEKARFLQDVGFSQLVLARELSLGEISGICSAVTVPVETFVHGALCVSYSGRCHASCATRSRSANRGECAQICRLPYTLTDASGHVICKDRHLLSLKDLNTLDLLPDLAAAGVSSFKIEGRLKERDYVKNVTATYRAALDRLIAAAPHLYCRSSRGVSEIGFTPDPLKSFNRGFSHYFLKERRPASIASLLTPKSLGEPIGSVDQLHPGDGISFFNRKGEYQGVLVNGVTHDGIRGNRPFTLPSGARIFRTLDVEWRKRLSRPTASRTLWMDVELDVSGVTFRAEGELEVRLPLPCPPQPSERSFDYRAVFAKLGNTPFRLRGYHSRIDDRSFLPLSALTALRREGVANLLKAAICRYPLHLRREELKEARYPADSLDYRDNVANDLARGFYRDHGVTGTIEPALEVMPDLSNGKRAHKRRVLMTCRHCVLRELGLCMKEGNRPAQPLCISSGDLRFELCFDCTRCEMQVIG